MKCIDANVLLYAHDQASPFHREAASWLTAAFNATEKVAIPMLCVAGFLRISTDTRLPRTSLRMAEALATVDSWIAAGAELLHTDVEHWHDLQQQLHLGKVTGAMVTDAQIAALTLRHGATLYTTDSDFARFPGLRWVNPITSMRRR